MRKGFTLIELLAVIVILAIIAVIAVPIVIDIIENSKVSANKRSIENYIHAVELAISQSILEGNNLSDGYHNIEMFDVKVNGETPDYGYLEIKDGKIKGYHLNINNKSFSKTEGDIENSKDIDETKIDPIKMVSELSVDWVNQDIIKGISFSYEETLTFNFYIDKNQMKDKKIYLRVKNETRYSSTAELISIVTEYNQTNNYIIFNYKDLRFQEFTNDTLFEIVEEDGTENGKVIDSITYDVSTYAENKIYETKNEYEKEFLIALINLGTAVQTQHNYKVDNLAYNILKEEDKNTNKLTQVGLNFYNKISQFNIELENNNNQVFIDIGVTVRTPTLNIGNIVLSAISFQQTTNFLEENVHKYGFLIFIEEAYNKLKPKGKESFNINSKEIDEVIDKNNKKTNYLISNKYLYIKYDLPIKKISDILCAIPYYIDDSGIYRYGALVKFSPIFIAKDYIENASTKENMKNLSYSLINFAAVIK